jgi:hypothetical protein
VLGRRRLRAPELPDAPAARVVIDTSIGHQADAPAGRRTLSERFPFLRPESAVPTYAGIALGLGGFALITYTWGRVAGLLLVPLQLPYIISAGLTGLGLILVGSVLVSVQAKRQDAAAEAKQLEELASVLREIGRAREEPKRPRRRTAR